jgi:hypothetical protein
LKATPLLTCLRKGFAIAVIHSEKGVTPRIVFPAERRLDRSARHPGPIQQIKRYSHDRMLHIRVPGLPARISEWKVCEHKASDTALLNDVPLGAHDCCWNSILLQMPSDQTHGLMAHRSKS